MVSEFAGDGSESGAQASLPPSHYLFAVVDVVAVVVVIVVSQSRMFPDMFCRHEIFSLLVQPPSISSCKRFPLGQ